MSSPVGLIDTRRLPLSQDAEVLVQLTCAHSGTVLGLLVPPDKRNACDILDRAQAAFPALVEAWVAQIVNGGVRPG